MLDGGNFCTLQVFRRTLGTGPAEAWDHEGRPGSMRHKHITTTAEAYMDHVLESVMKQSEGMNERTRHSLGVQLPVGHIFSARSHRADGIHDLDHWFDPPLAAEAARAMVFSSPDTAVARRSWFTESGRGRDKADLFVFSSRVKRPDKIPPNRAIRVPAALPATSAASNSMNLMPASKSPAAAISMPFAGVPALTASAEGANCAAPLDGLKRRASAGAWSTTGLGRPGWCAKISFAACSTVFRPSFSKLISSAGESNTPANRGFFSRMVSHTRSSMLPVVSMWTTWPGRACPGRGTRPIRCSSRAGFHGGSKLTTAEADCRFRPTPPASVERNTLHAGSSRNFAMSLPRWREGTPP